MMVGRNVVLNHYNLPRGRKYQDVFSDHHCSPRKISAHFGSKRASQSDRCLLAGIRRVVSKLYTPCDYTATRAKVANSTLCYFYEILDNLTSANYEFEKLQDTFYSCFRDNKKCYSPCADDKMGNLDLSAKTLLNLVQGLKQELKNKQKEKCELNHTLYMINSFETKLHTLVNNIEYFKGKIFQERYNFRKSTGSCEDNLNRQAILKKVYLPKTCTRSKLLNNTQTKPNHMYLSNNELHTLSRKNKTNRRNTNELVQPKIIDNNDYTSGYKYSLSNDRLHNKYSRRGNWRAISKTDGLRINYNSKGNIRKVNHYKQRDELQKGNYKKKVYHTRFPSSKSLNRYYYLNDENSNVDILNSKENKRRQRNIFSSDFAQVSNTPNYKCDDNDMVNIKKTKQPFGMFCNNNKPRMRTGWSSDRGRNRRQKSTFRARKKSKQKRNINPSKRNILQKSMLVFSNRSNKSILSQNHQPEKKVKIKISENLKRGRENRRSPFSVNWSKHESPRHFYIKKRKPIKRQESYNSRLYKPKEFVSAERFSSEEEVTFDFRDENQTREIMNCKPLEKGKQFRVSYSPNRSYRNKENNNNYITKKDDYFRKFQASDSVNIDDKNSYFEKIKLLKTNNYQGKYNPCNDIFCNSPTKECQQCNKLFYCNSIYTDLCDKGNIIVLCDKCLQDLCYSDDCSDYDSEDSDYSPKLRSKENFEVYLPKKESKRSHYTLEELRQSDYVYPNKKSRVYVKKLKQYSTMNSEEDEISYESLQEFDFGDSKSSGSSSYLFKEEVRRRSVSKQRYSTSKEVEEFSKHSLKLSRKINTTEKRNNSYVRLARFVKESNEKIVEYELPQIESSIKEAYSTETNTDTLQTVSKQTSTTELIKIIKAVGTNTHKVSTREQGIDSIPQNKKKTIIKRKSKFTSTMKLKTLSIGIDCMPQISKPKTLDSSTDPIHPIGQKNKHTNTLPKVKTLTKEAGTDLRHSKKVPQANAATDPLYLGKSEKQTSTLIPTRDAQTEAKIEILTKPLAVHKGTDPARVDVIHKQSSYDKVKTTDRGTNAILKKMVDKDQQFETYEAKPKVKHAQTSIGATQTAGKMVQTRLVKDVKRPSLREKEVQTAKKVTESRGVDPVKLLTQEKDVQTIQKFVQSRGVDPVMPEKEIRTSKKVLQSRGTDPERVFINEKAVQTTKKVVQSRGVDPIKLVMPEKEIQTEKKVLQSQGTDPERVFINEKAVQTTKKVVQSRGVDPEKLFMPEKELQTELKKMITRGVNSEKLLGFEKVTQTEEKETFSRGVHPAQLLKYHKLVQTKFNSTVSRGMNSEKILRHEKDVQTIAKKTFSKGINPDKPRFNYKEVQTSNKRAFSRDNNSVTTSILTGSESNQESERSVSKSELSMHLVFEKCHEDIYKKLGTDLEPLRRTYPTDMHTHKLECRNKQPKIIRECGENITKQHNQEKGDCHFELTLQKSRPTKSTGNYYSNETMIKNKQTKVEKEIKRKRSNRKKKRSHIYSNRYCLVDSKPVDGNTSASETRDSKSDDLTENSFWQNIANKVKYEHAFH